ncbi:MAG: hypothetical protein V3U24_11460 [Candidatus Neomarinimicrobiota bacterium]
MTKAVPPLSLHAIRGSGSCPPRQPAARGPAGREPDRPVAKYQRNGATVRGFLRLFYLLSFIFYLGPLWASGAYDHGTATGKGKLELDFTWNPFNIFKFGQSYVVLGYGITQRLDVHGYYSVHPEGFHTYYYGLFYQFLDSKRVDLATAVGLRTKLKTGSIDIFFPQVLYNIKLGKSYTIGGSIVSVQDPRNLENIVLRSTIDIALFIPISRYVSPPSFIDELRLGLGVFNPVTNLDVKSGQFVPTYSVDVKFDWKKE